MFLLLFMIPGIVSLSFSQNSTEEFIPKGKPLALIFTNFHTASSDGETMPAFENTRAYLGYEYNFSKDFYAKVVFDVGNPKDGAGHELSAYLKNAYVQYSTGNLKAYFGMIFKFLQPGLQNFYLNLSY